jgi:hypothetical protein
MQTTVRNVSPSTHSQSIRWASSPAAMPSAAEEDEMCLAMQHACKTGRAHRGSRAGTRRQLACPCVRGKSADPDLRDLKTVDERSESAPRMARPTAMPRQLLLPSASPAPSACLHCRSKLPRRTVQAFRHRRRFSSALSFLLLSCVLIALLTSHFLKSAYCPSFSSTSLPSSPSPSQPASHHVVIR